MPAPIRCCFYRLDDGRLVQKCVDFLDPLGCPLFISHGGEVLPLVAEFSGPVANCGDCAPRRGRPRPAGFENVIDADDEA